MQRSRLLDAVLADLYGPRSLLTDGVLPPELVFAHPGYVRAASGIEVPGHHQLFMHACDVSRVPDGGFQVNADWTQAPSGAGYALADRRVVAHSIPDLYETDRAAADDAVRAGAAAGAHRRRTRRRPGPGGRGAQPRHLLGDRVRSGVSGHAAGLSAGGKRGPGGARRQAVDALAGHAETRRRGPAPRRRGVHGPAGSARRFPARCGRFGGGAAPRDGDRRQHAGQRHPGKPWAAALSARARRAAARRSPAAADRAGLLGRHRQRTLAPAGQPLVAVDQVHRRRENPCRTDTFVRAAGRAGRADRAHAVAVGRPGAAAVLVGAHRPRRRVVVGRCRHAVVHGRPTQRLRADDRRRRLRAGTRARGIYAENRCGKRCLGAADGARAGRDGDRSPSALAPAKTAAGTWGVSSPRVLSDLFWMGRYGERAEEHGPVADRRPRPLPRLPAPAGHRGKRVRAGADGRAGPDHRDRHRSTATTTPR